MGRTITESWNTGFGKKTVVYVPVPKRVVLAKAMECDYTRYWSKPVPSEKYEVSLKKSGQTVDVFIAMASLHDIFVHGGFNGDRHRFKDFFRDFEVWVTPDLSQDNVLLTSKSDGVVLRLQGTAPNANIYPYKDFFATKERFQKPCILYDIHNGESLPDAMYRAKTRARI